MAVVYSNICFAFTDRRGSLLAASRESEISVGGEGGREGGREGGGRERKRVGGREGKRVGGRERGIEEGERKRKKGGTFNNVILCFRLASRRRQ